MKPAVPTLCMLACLLAAVVPARAQESVLRGEFWVELEPMPREGTPWPIDKDAAARELLNEGARVFSAVVWGFDFVYTPPDSVLEVEEVFTLVPSAVLPFGDNRLRVSALRATGSVMRVYLEYHASLLDQARMEGWRGATFKSVQGRGSAPAAAGTEARSVAYERAVKEALRALLRPIAKNKPREVRGVVAYASIPSVIMSEGNYVATVRVRVRVDEIVPYAIY